MVRSGWARDCSPLHSVQTGSEAHQASNPMGTGAISLRVKRLGREANHTSPSSAEAKSGGVIPPLHNVSPWPGAHLIQDRSNFIFTFTADIQIN
jgi:hypothetical protein